MIRLAFAIGLVMARLILAGQREDPRGDLSGQVLDARSQDALTGATVQVVGQELGARCAEDGRFQIRQIPAGVHALRVSQLGYATVVVTDVVVRPGRDLPLLIHLEPGDLKLQGVEVRPDFYATRTSQGSVTQHFNREEIRRAPGSAEDVNRLVQALPSVGMGGDDQRNDIIVRGGNSMENLFLVDGHPIHNINHFGSQGSTGGPIGLIHVDFIDQVQFSPGGFDARHGDRLSSVMDIHFREGSRQALDGEAMVSMAGLGLEMEGPLDGGKGSWLLGARRSYLELLKQQIGYARAPVMADLGGKAVLDLDEAWQLSALLLSGMNSIRFTTEEDPDQNFNVKNDQFNLSGGLALRHLGKGGRRTRVGLTLNRQDFDNAYSAWNDVNRIRNDAWEQNLDLGVEHHLPGRLVDLSLGVGVDHATSRHRVQLEDMISQWGDTLPDSRLDLDHRQNRGWAMVQSEWRGIPGQKVNAGLRVDHDDDLGTTDWQPRISHRLEWGGGWALNSAAGLYAQGLPVYWRVQSATHAGVQSMRSIHLQGGLEWRPQPEWLLSLDLYQRHYRQLPVSRLNPTLPLADAGSSYGYSYLGGVESTGRGHSQGVELLAQKKLSGHSYGSFSYSWSLSSYKTPAGSWVLGPFDRRHMATVILGWIPNHRWECSMKWRIYGGLPVTPIDVDASRSAGDTRFQLDDYQADRQGVYHRLDLRVDHRIQGRRFNLVQFWDIENAYDQRNEAFKYWHHNQDKVKTWYGWRIMPVYGLTLEF